jgi:hypothetical protein
MRKPIDHTVAELVDLLDDNLAEMFQERAAVREYDGGYTRDHAEALALLDVITRYPDALSGVTVFAIELDGTTHWVVTTDREYVRSIGARTDTTPEGRADLASVLRNAFGGTALLAALEPSVRV